MDNCDHFFAAITDTQSQCRKCGKVVSEKPPEARVLEAELARVREDLKAWERNCASLIAHRDEVLDKIERMALRAAQIISENSHEFGAREITPDEAVAQAMREEG